MAKRTNPSSSATRPPPSPSPTLLLAALPPAAYQRLLPPLEIVPPPLKPVLHRPGEPIDRVYFPDAGFCSILIVLKDGAMVEVATIGREGAAGVAAVLSAVATAATTMVQGETDACHTMPAPVFRREMERRDTFYEVMTRYTHALM